MRWRFFARRLAMLLVSLLVASFVIFAAVYLAPGSPIAALSGGRSLPPSSVRILEQRYHLNAPFFAQYWYWLDNVLHGNLDLRGRCLVREFTSGVGAMEVECIERRMDAALQEDCKQSPHDQVQRPLSGG